MTKYFFIYYLGQNKTCNCYFSNIFYCFLLKKSRQVGQNIRVRASQINHRFFLFPKFQNREKANSENSFIFDSCDFYFLHLIYLILESRYLNYNSLVSARQPVPLGRTGSWITGEFVLKRLSGVTFESKRRRYNWRIFNRTRRFPRSR